MLHADADIGEEVIRKDDNGVDESNLDLNNDSTSDSDITVLIDLEDEAPRTKLAKLPPREEIVSSSVFESSAHLLLSLRSRSSSSSSSSPGHASSSLSSSTSVAIKPPSLQPLPLQSAPTLQSVLPSQSVRQTKLQSPHPPSFSTSLPLPPTPPLLQLQPEPLVFLPASYRNSSRNACFEGTEKVIYPIRPSYTDSFYKHRNKVRVFGMEPLGPPPEGATFTFVVGDQVEMPSGYVFKVDRCFLMEGIEWYRLIRSYPDAPSVMVTDESDLSLYDVGLSRKRLRRRPSLIQA
jgi:hypothetical protein